MEYQWKCPKCGWLNENELLPVGQEGYRCIPCFSETEEEIGSDEDITEKDDQLCQHGDHPERKAYASITA